jgi:hypothetical protein
MNLRITSVFLVLAIASLACGFSVDLPDMPTPGPDVTEQISVPVPGSGETSLKFDFGAGKLDLSPGAGGALVQGTATYNVPDFKPEISVQGNAVTLRPGNFEFDSFPNFKDLKNDWLLQLGDSPMALTVEAGAYEAEYEFGGLSLSSLTIKDGAANVKLAFSSPNKSQMSLLRYETGASQVEMTGLANANFNTLAFQAGAGNYTLDFSGALQHDATVTISSGLSNFVLVIPTDVNAVVTVESGISNVDAGANWDKNGNEYTQTGSGPTLTFIVEMGAGALKLTD